jgi:hypothetical protein
MADTTPSEEVSHDMDDQLWRIKFAVEVSTRYHDWRRGTFEGLARFVKLVTLIGAIFTLLTAFNPLDLSSPTVTKSIAIASIVVACINLVDLVWDFGGMALKHTELYRRFKELQERIVRGGSEWQSHVAEWEGDSQLIRRDEPPTMWAVYAMCWNQTIGRYQVEQRGYLRPVSSLRTVFRNIFQFRPQDFPAGG